MASYRCVVADEKCSVAFGKPMAFQVDDLLRFCIAAGYSLPAPEIFFVFRYHYNVINLFH